MRLPHQTANAPIARAASPETSTSVVPPPVNGSCAPVVPPVAELDRTVGRVGGVGRGAIERGSGAVSTEAGPRTTGPSVVDVVDVEVDDVEVVDVLLVELVVDVEVVVALGRTVAGGAVGTGSGVAKAPGAAITIPRTAAASTVVNQVALGRNGCAAVTDPPRSRVDAAAPIQARPRARTTVTPGTRKVGDLAELGGCEPTRGGC